MTSFMALDGVTSFLRLKDFTITCKRMRRSLSIGGSSSVQWRKGGWSWRLRMCFRHLLCVRIEIDRLQCVNCWVIIHCLSVSCTKINHSRCALVIWYSIQLTSKHWIITQQFTATADLFLNYIHSSTAIREIWLLCLICLPGVSWWLSGSSSRCHGVVCGLWLWFFLIILTYYFLLVLFTVSSMMPCWILNNIVNLLM